MNKRENLVVSLALSVVLLGLTAWQIISDASNSVRLFWNIVIVACSGFTAGILYTELAKINGDTTKETL